MESVAWGENNYNFKFRFVQIQELGLQQQYSNDQGTYLYLRKFMALPFLPEDQIPPMFEQLSLKATTAPLKQFVNYVTETWIRSSIWPPSSWSVFMMATRSNNDIEGWHKGLHRRASGRWNMPFYLLIDLLHQEARLTALRIRLVSEKNWPGFSARNTGQSKPKYLIFGMITVAKEKMRNSFVNVPISMDLNALDK